MGPRPKSAQDLKSRGTTHLRRARYTNTKPFALPTLSNEEPIMEKRVYNFSPGPAVLPLPALQEAQRDLLALPGTGISILEISHRSKAFEKIINQAEANLRTLLGIPSNYRVLFLQGGALLQFGMVPDEPVGRHGQVGRLRRERHLEQEGPRRGQDPKRHPRGLGRQAGQFQPRAPQRRVETRSERGLRLYRQQRDDPGRAVPQGARDRRRAAGVRFVVRLPLPAGGRSRSTASCLPVPRRTPGRRA